jgi:hypothetical protein
METLVKTHWKKVFNSDYLGSCDLEDGKDLKCIIKSVTVRKVKNTDGKEQERNVATFTDPKIKPMILNATNCKIVKKFTKSSFINDWNNVPIQIYVKDDIRAFGDVTEGLRIREIQPAASKPKLNRNMPAWSKVVSAVREGKALSDIEKVYDLTDVKDEILKEAV